MIEEYFYLFVYGSLRSGFQSEAYQYISRYFTFIANAKVKGMLYDLGNYPAAIPTHLEYFIVGELYKIKNEDEFNWAIEQLDDYEGLNVEEGQTALYKRSIANVFVENEIIPAWVYWYNRSIENKPLIESGDILQYLQGKTK